MNNGESKRQMQSQKRHTYTCLPPSTILAPSAGNAHSKVHVSQQLRLQTKAVKGRGGPLVDISTYAIGLSPTHQFDSLLRIAQSRISDTFLGIGSIVIAPSHFTQREDVVNKKGTCPGCITRPNFDLPSEVGVLYHKVHKLHNMVDVVHRQFRRPFGSRRGQTRRCQK